MAGESPDRSEQKQSSGETAPKGNAPSPADVPEARADRAASDRTAPAAPADTAEGPSADASDAPGGPGGEAASEARPGLEQRKPASGRTGTATRGSRPGANDADGADGAAEDGARSSAGSPASEKPAGGADRDTRLRAAVAAWVSGDDEGEGDAAEGPAGDGQEAASDASASTDGPAADASADDARPGPTAAARAKGAAALAQAAKGRAKAARDQSAAGGRTGQDEPAADRAADTDPAEAGAERAGDGKQTDGKQVDGGKQSGDGKQAGDGKQTDGKRSGGGKSGGKQAGGKQGGSGKTGGKQAEGGQGGGDAAGRSAVKDGGQRKSTTSATEGTTGGPESDSATAVFRLPASDGAKSATTGGDAAAKGAGDAAKPDSGRTPSAASDDGGDRATAVFKLPAADDAKGTAPAKDTDTTHLAGANGQRERSEGEGTGGAKAAGGAKGGSPAEGADAAKNAAKGAAKKGTAAEAGRRADAEDEVVDHPTTMFKAVAKPGAGTKSDGASKAAGGTKPKDGTEPKDGTRSDAANAAKGGGTAAAEGKAAESESERTSRFVALRSTDAPAAKAAPPKPSTPPTPRRPATEPAETPAAASAGTAAPGTADAEKTAMIGALPEAERTKQQPLPPLDLLAKLTNTPPPPPTPLRTAVRRFKIWTPLVILLAIVFVVVQAVRPLPAPALTLGGTTAYTFKGDYSTPWPGKGQGAAKVVGVGSLGDFGPQKPVPTASVAKVMTAYVVLRDHPLKANAQGPQIPVDATAEQQSQAADESRVPLKQGRQYSERQMLELLMIPSGNNVARLLARWDAGSEGAFVKKMSAQAKKLGMSNTTYTDPSGLTKTTKSTAVDQLKLAEQVMKYETFRQVVTMENVKVDGIPEQYANNKLLTYEPNIVRGIKTGSSTPAGGAFVWAAYKGVAGKDRLIIGVLMDQRAPNSNPNADLDVALNNSRHVIDDVRSHLTSAKVVRKGQVVGYVDDGLGGQTPVVATKDLTAAGWPGMKVDFSLDDQGKTIPHEAKAGTRVGVLKAGSGASAVRIPVVLQQDMAKPTFGAKLVRIG